MTLNNEPLFINFVNKLFYAKEMSEDNILHDEMDQQLRGWGFLADEID